jgi:hypothetical protein
LYNGIEKLLNARGVRALTLEFRVFFQAVHPPRRPFRYIIA